MRDEFEKWISAPPYEHLCRRHGPDAAFPDQYKEYETQLAWEAWQKASETLLEVTMGIDPE